MHLSSPSSCSRELTIRQDAHKSSVTEDGVDFRISSSLHSFTISISNGIYIAVALYVISSGAYKLIDLFQSRVLGITTHHQGGEGSNVRAPLIIQGSDDSL